MSCHRQCSVNSVRSLQRAKLRSALANLALAHTEITCTVIYLVTFWSISGLSGRQLHVKFCLHPV